MFSTTIHNVDNKGPEITWFDHFVHTWPKSKEDRDTYRISIPSLKISITLIYKPIGQTLVTMKPAKYAEGQKD